MKKLFLLLLFAVFAMVGCEELNPEEIQNIIDNIEMPEGTEEPVFYADCHGVCDAPKEGGVVVIDLITNLDYVVYIPDEAQDWVTHLDTRAIRLDKLCFSVAKNNTMEERKVTIDLIGLEGEVLQSLVFKQEAMPIVLTLTADKNKVSVGNAVTFKVTDELGRDLTKSAQIYDAELNKVDSVFTLKKAGRYTFFATVGVSTSNNVNVVVLAQMPQVSADPNPSNLAFHHKMLVIKHGGVDCYACPSAIEELHKLAETQWKEYYNLVDNHAGGFANSDPANSKAAEALYDFQLDYLVSGFPKVIVDFYTKLNSYLCKSIVEVIESRVKMDGAEVGITMAVDGDPENVYCAAQIKSAVSQEYKVNAWLLESDIYSPYQKGASKDFYYDYALRDMSSVENGKYDVTGTSIGIIEAGSTCDFAVELPITSSKWNVENMGVVIVVSALNEKNRWEIVNTAYCPMSKSLVYRYVGDSEVMHSL